MSKFTVAIRLFIITAVAAVCLAFANKITAPITQANNEKAFQESLKEALPIAKEFKQLDPGVYDDETITINSIYAGYEDKKQEKLCGYVVTVTSSEGYGGNLCVIVGIDKNYAVTKAMISTPFNETPGLGAKAKDADFIDQFKGKTGLLEVVKGDAKGDEEISAITSATTTSTAVTKCVNAALETVSVSADKTSAAAEEAHQAYTEKEEQSQAELDAVEENRKDQPTPVIKDEEDKEVSDNE